MDSKFWKFIWLLVASVACVIIVSLTSCVIHADYRIAKAINAGANPLEARYAFSGAIHSADLSILRLSQINRICEEPVKE